MKSINAAWVRRLGPMLLGLVLNAVLTGSLIIQYFVYFTSGSKRYDPHVQRAIITVWPIPTKGSSMDKTDGVIYLMSFVNGSVSLNIARKVLFLLLADFLNFAFDLAFVWLYVEGLYTILRRFYWLSAAPRYTVSHFGRWFAFDTWAWSHCLS